MHMYKAALFLNECWYEKQMNIFCYDAYSEIGVAFLMLTSWIDITIDVVKIAINKMLH